MSPASPSRQQGWRLPGADHESPKRLKQTLASPTTFKAPDKPHVHTFLLTSEPAPHPLLQRGSQRQKQTVRPSNNQDSGGQAVTANPANANPERHATFARTLPRHCTSALGGHAHGKRAMACAQLSEAPNSAPALTSTQSMAASGAGAGKWRSRAGTGARAIKVNGQTVQGAHGATLRSGQQAPLPVHQKAFAHAGVSARQAGHDHLVRDPHLGWPLGIHANGPTRPFAALPDRPARRRCCSSGPVFELPKSQSRRVLAAAPLAAEHRIGLEILRLHPGAQMALRAWRPHRSNCAGCGTAPASESRRIAQARLGRGMANQQRTPLCRHKAKFGMGLASGCACRPSPKLPTLGQGSRRSHGPKSLRRKIQTLGVS
jgi:hypothetical protein